MMARLESMVQTAVEKGLQHGQQLRTRFEQLIRETTHHDLRNHTSQMHGDVQTVVRDTLQTEAGTIGSPVQTTLATAAENAVTTALAPGNPLRNQIDTAAAHAATAAIPTAADRVDETIAAMQPGSPRRADFEHAVQGMVPTTPAADVVHDIDTASQPASPRRAALETAVRRLIPRVFTEPEIRAIADQQIAAAGGVPAGDVVSRRWLITYGGGGLAATFLACALGDWLQDTTGWPWSGPRGPQGPQGPQGPAGTGGGTTPPTENPTIESTPQPSLNDFKETGPGQTAQFNQTVDPGSKFVVFAYGMLGTRNYKDGIIAAFDGSIQETIDDGVYGVWSNDSALAHFIYKTRQYITHDTQYPNKPYAPTYVLIPQSWAGRLPSDVQNYLNGRNIQYL